MTIPGMRLRPRDMRSDVAPLELDLVAFFAVVFDDLYNDLDAAVEDGLSPYEFLDGIDLSLGGAGPRVPYADEVEKNHRLAGRMDFQGLPISVEHWKGGVRSGVDPDGKEWRTKMHLPYGYIRGTRGVDGDEVDCFIGPDRDSTQVFVVHTYKPGTIEYDEDKVMLGFSSIIEAQRWLEAHYDRTIIQGIDTMDIEKLKRALAEAPGKMLRKSLDNLNASVAKAQGFKPGTMRKWADGNWHIKLPDGSWETAYDPFSRNGWEKNRKLLEQRGFSHLDIVDEEGKNIGRLHKLGHQGSADVLPSKDLPTPAKGKPGAPKAPKEDPAVVMRRRLMDWAKDEPDAFNDKLAGVVVDQMGGNLPHGVEQKDIKRMMENMSWARKMVIAEQNHVAAPGGLPSDLWDDLGWKDRIGADRNRVVDELVAYQRVKNGLNSAQAQEKRDRYVKLNDAELYKRIGMYFNANMMAKPALIKKYLKDLDKQKKEKEERAKIFENLDAHQADIERPSEIVLHDWDVSPEQRVGNVKAHGINGIEVKKLHGPAGDERRFVFKAQKDEYGAVLRKFIPQGEQFVRERAGYVLNKLVGLNNRPAVVLRKVHGNMGAMVDFIPNAEHIDSSEYDQFPVLEWQKLALHHWLCANGDAHGMNMMADKKNKKLFAIDDGLAFPGGFVKEGATYRSKAHKYLDQKKALDLPDEILVNVNEGVRDKAVDAVKLLGLGDKAAEVVKWRFDYIIKNRRLPEYDGYDECNRLEDEPV